MFLKELHGFSREIAKEIMKMEKRELTKEEYLVLKKLEEEDLSFRVK